MTVNAEQCGRRFQSDLLVRERPAAGIKNFSQNPHPCGSLQKEALVIFFRRGPSSQQQLAYKLWLWLPIIPSSTTIYSTLFTTTKKSCQPLPHWALPSRCSPDGWHRPNRAPHPSPRRTPSCCGGPTGTAVLLMKQKTRNLRPSSRTITKCVLGKDLLPGRCTDKRRVVVNKRPCCVPCMVILLLLLLVMIMMMMMRRIKKVMRQHPPPCRHCLDPLR